MAPANPKPVYEAEERCLCFHGQLLYEAKVLKVEHQEEGNKKSPFKYLVHYKGWKKTWDDWALEDRMRKFNDENLELRDRLENEVKNRSKEGRRSLFAKRKSGRAESVLDSEDRSSSVAGPTRGAKRGLDNFIEKEESFVVFPAVRIKLPDLLKSKLVDDWEAVTKNLQLVPLPVQTPISDLLSEYRKEKMRGMRLGSADADILEEVIVGLLEYFNRALPRILLYRLERQQWAEIQPLLEDVDNAPRSKKAKLTAPTRDGFDPAEIAGKNPADVYGAEHLLRLFVSLPELIAQTNMDKQAVQRLREEIESLANWLSRRSGKLFTEDYESAAPDYRQQLKVAH